MNNEIYSKVEKLVYSLSAAEKKVLLNHLNSNLLPWQKESKIAELLKWLDPEKNEENTVPPEYFSLKNYEALEASLFDSLFLDINIHRRRKGWEKTYLHKELAKLQFFSQNNFFENIYYHAERCRNLAVKYGDHDKVLEALYAKLFSAGFYNDNASHIEDIRKEIGHYEKLQMISRKCQRLLFDLRIKRQQTYTENDIIGFIDENFAELVVYKEDCPLPILAFTLQYLRKEKLEIIENYEEARQLNIRLYSPVKQLSSLLPYSFSIWELTLDHARICYKQGHITDARNFAESCLKNTEEYQEIHYRALKLLFYILYFDKKYKEAADLIESYSKTLFYRNILPDHLRGIWKYLLACTYFRAKNFQKCKRILNQKNPLEKNNKHDAIQLKFLRVMTAIEQKDYYRSDKYLDTLKKYVSRNGLTQLMEETGLSYFYEDINKLRIVRYDWKTYAKVYEIHQKHSEPDSYDFRLDFYRIALPFSTWFHSKVKKPQKTTLVNWKKKALDQHFSRGSRRKTLADFTGNRKRRRI